MSNTASNQPNCIFPKCRCQFRCSDLFENTGAIDLKAGHCFSCGTFSTVYFYDQQYRCKSCIAKEKNLTIGSKVALLIVVLAFLLPLSVSAQTLLKFISADSADSVSNVIILTSNHHKLTTGNSASIVVNRNDFPISVFRTGMESQTLSFPGDGEKNIVLQPNNSYPTVTVIGKKENHTTDFYHSIPTLKSINDSLSKKGITSIKHFVTSRSELQLRDFGGSGGFQTAASRGTTSAQNITTINGIIINDLTTGTANLSKIPFDYFSAIELQTGGFSADISNGAFGSVLSFTTDASPESRFQFTATTASFETRKTSVLARNEVFRWYADYAQSNNNFPFPFLSVNGTKILNRSNNASEQFSVNVGVTIPVSSDQLSTDFFIHSNHSGIPGPMYVDNIFPSNAHLSQQDFRNITTYAIHRTESVIRHSS